MTHVPVRVSSPAEAARLDRVAIEDFGLPGIVLMETAARSVLWHALRTWEDLGTGRRSILVLNGPGQNGGDGWVLARLLSAMGHDARCLFLAGPGREPKGDALVNREVVLNLGIPVSRFDGETSDLPGVGRTDLIVDAIFGTGLDKPLSGAPLRLLEHLNKVPGTFRVLAVDLPSGLDGETGESLGPVLRADLTVSLGTLKRGLFLRDGPELAGEIRLGDIGLCPPMFGKAGIKGKLLDSREAARLLPPRPLSGHKGTFGHAVLAGGSQGKSGALALAAAGALRAGAGLVTACHPPGLAAIMEEKLTSPMTLSLPGSERGLLDGRAAPVFLRFLRGKTAFALGPGMGLSEDTREFVEKVVAGTDLPAVLDADALNALSGRLSILRERKGPTVITPHPGEAATLLGTTAEEVQRDRFGTAVKLAELSGAVAVLKGRHTIVMEPGTFAHYFNVSGGPVLASGGTGDLLAGLVAGFLARKADPFAAAALGVHLHGLAADLAEKELGPVGVAPEEIQRFFPKAHAVLAGL